MKYKIKYTYSSRNDMREMKRYILNNFKYYELGENFTKKMKKAADKLKTLPASYDTIGLKYRGYDIFLKPYQSYLFFYIVDENASTVIVLRVLKDGMNWQNILNRWIKEHE